MAAHGRLEKIDKHRLQPEGVMIFKLHHQRATGFVVMDGSAGAAINRRSPATGMADVVVINRSVHRLAASRAKRRGYHRQARAAIPA